MKYEFFDRLCKAHHVTPYKVSKATGISTGTLSHWKKGLYSPKAEKIQRIADYFDVPLEYFTTGELPQKGYYMNEGVAEIAQRLLDNPDMRVLFDAAEDASPEDLQMAAALLERLKRTNIDG